MLKSTELRNRFKRGTTLRTNDKPTIVTVSDGSIEVDSSSWRLLGQNGNLRGVLVEAVPGRGLVYRADLSARFGLPGTGVVPVEQIEYVAAMWLSEPGCWSLGISLFPGDARPAKPTWCELARLPSGGRPGDVELAGRALAGTLGVPFHVVNAPSASPVEPGVTPLPVSFPMPLGDVEMEEIPGGLLIRRSGKWLRGCLTKLTLYPLLAVIYALFSIKEMTSPYAHNEIEWLPVAGLLIALWLIGLWIHSWATLLRATDVILEPAAKSAYRVSTLSRLLKRDPPKRDHIRLDGECGIIAYQLSGGERDEWELLLSCKFARPWHIASVIEKPDGGIPLAVQAAHVIAAAMHLPLRVRRIER